MWTWCQLQFQDVPLLSSSTKLPNLATFCQIPTLTSHCHPVSTTTHLPVFITFHSCNDTWVVPRGFHFNLYNMVQSKCSVNKSLDLSDEILILLHVQEQWVTSGNRHESVSVVQSRHHANRFKNSIVFNHVVSTMSQFRIL